MVNHTKRWTAYRMILPGAFGVAAGTVAYIVGIIDALPDLRAVAVVLSIIGAQLWITRGIVKAMREIHGPSRTMYDKGFEAGENAGYWKGRRVARPVLVPINRGGQSDDGPATLFSP